MAGCVHHIGIKTNHFDDSVRFFQELFGMEAERTRGEAPHRILWFRQGIQLNETPEPLSAGGSMDHIGMRVKSWPETRARAAELGCQEIPGKPHWFITPEGIVIELKE